MDSKGKQNNVADHVFNKSYLGLNMLSDNIFSLDFDVGCSDFLLQSTFVTVKYLKIIRKT